MDWRKQRIVQKLHKNGVIEKSDEQKQGDRENSLPFVQALQRKIRKKPLNVFKKAKKTEFITLSTCNQVNWGDSSRKLLIFLRNSSWFDLILLYFINFISREQKIFSEWDNFFNFFKLLSLLANFWFFYGENP